MGARSKLVLVEPEVITRLRVTVALGEAAVAVNADGTLNDCANPATAGSVVTVFLDGLGAVNPVQLTGIITPTPAVALTPAVDANTGSSTMAIATMTVPGAISGVGQVKLELLKA